MHKTTFHITGMHCRGCKNLIESEIKDLVGVNSVDVDHVKGEMIVEHDEKMNEGEIKNAVRELGYDFIENTAHKPLSINHYWQLLLPIALFIIAYLLIQNFGAFELMGKLNEKSLSLGLVFLIGVLASFHCIGMCGGFVVAYTTTITNNQSRSLGTRDKQNSKMLPHFQYNLGRLVSYTIIGGILGGIGSFFGINPNFSGALLIVAGIFMILMGLSLFTNFKWLKKIKLSTPEFIGRYIFSNKKSTHPKGPLFIGFTTGFMPCGPLQAMQLYALSTGSFFGGSSAMLFYSLGTIPLIFGFGNLLTVISQSRIKQIYKISGLIVLLLGIMTINRGLTNFNSGFKTTETEQAQKDDVQVITMDVTGYGYKPNVIYIKKDIPVRWIIRDKGITGCTDEIILYHESSQIKKRLDQNENVVEFTPTKLGEMKFSCWMRMVWGKFIVVDNNADLKNSKTNSTPPTTGENCIHTKDGEVCN